MKPTRTCSAILLGLAFTLGANAQSVHRLTDDPDVLVWDFPSTTMRMAGTEDGRIVATWVLPAGNIGGGDELMVAVSSDKGRTWKTLWDGSKSLISHSRKITDLSVAVTAVHAAWAPKRPQVYIAVEQFDYYLGKPAQRSITCYAGSIDLPWSSYFGNLKGKHVAGQYYHQFQPENQGIPSRPSVAVLPYGRNAGDYLVVIAFHWPDSGNGTIYLSTPFVLHQPIDEDGKRISNTLALTGGGNPDLCADFGQQSMYLAFERNNAIEVWTYRASRFRRGNTAVSQTFRVGQDLYDPTIAAHEGTATLLCGQKYPAHVKSKTGRPLVRFVNLGTGGFVSQGVLHSSVHSRAELALFGSHAYAVANVDFDGTPRLGGFRGRNDTTHAWTHLPLGDYLDPSHATVAAVGNGSDGAAFGYLGWNGRNDGVFVDPGN